MQGPRLELEFPPHQGVVPAVWNMNEPISYLSQMREGESEANLQPPMAGNNDALLFGYYNQPVSEAYALNLPFHPFIGNNNMPK